MGEHLGTAVLLMTWKDRSKLVSATCVPLFMGSILADGHGAQTTSATATFVKFRGQTYIVTCRHVKQIAFGNEGWTARLHAHPAVIELAHWARAGRQPTLRDAGASEAIDISLCALPGHMMEMLAKDKPKAPIDLDRFNPPNGARSRIAWLRDFLIAQSPRRAPLWLHQ